MLVSVIIPVFNSSTYLKQTVDSIYSAGLMDFEIILVDDGSTDNSGYVCDCISEERSDIRCIHKENGGVSGARNRGISEAKGEYIIFIDSDDTIETDGMAEFPQLLRQYQPDLLIYGISFDYYHHNKLYRSDALIPSGNGLMNSAEWKKNIIDLFRTNALSSACTKVFKKDILVENNILFNRNVIEMEDFLFSMQVMQYCSNIYIFPKAIYRYRQSENENNSFRRISKIKDLNEYMNPFEELRDEWNNKMGIDISEIVNDIYLNFFTEILRFGSIKQIKSISENMLSGNYDQYVHLRMSSVYNLIINKRFVRLKLRMYWRGYRHWIAVRIKSILRGKRDV